MVTIVSKYIPAPKMSSGLRRWIIYRQRLRFEVFQRDKFTCRYCGRTVSDGAKLEVDHVIPESKGGEYVAENLLTACHKCNQAKADVLLKPPELEAIMGRPIPICPRLLCR